MTSSILIFTFSPIQSFISEARRAADLYTGSQILVKLAKAAAESIGKKNLIYPALDDNGDLPADIPNKLVAQVPFEEAEQIAGKAREALLQYWNKEYLEDGKLRDGLTKAARKAFEAELKKHDKNFPDFDNEIWERQTGDDYLWETYWSAAKLDGRDYKEVYKDAEAGLVAAKFTRRFSQYEEPGFKDTLSGKRQALRSKEEDGHKYWYRVGQVDDITPIKIRPSIKSGEPPKEHPRERLDALGVVKRFHPLAEKGLPPFSGFPSTSSIASLDYLDRVRGKIKGYKQALNTLFGDRAELMRVRPKDPDFPYDGDFLYMETLTEDRLKKDYSIKNVAYLKEARAALNKLQDEIKARPSTYYAIIVLDGDSMGEHLRTLDEQGHRKFSEDLYKFSKDVSTQVGKRGRVVYNGGDDVLAFAPLAFALPLAAELASHFKTSTGRSASAGIAIAHHLSPLGTALEAARHAEHLAKSLDGKDAVCVLALKRSGEPIQVMSKWDNLKVENVEAGLFNLLVEEFRGDDLSNKLPYDLFRSAYALPKADEMFSAELYRLIKRHLQKGSGNEKEEKASKFKGLLFQWSKSLVETEEMNAPQHLAQWLALARFAAQGGDA